MHQGRVWQKTSESRLKLQIHIVIGIQTLWTLRFCSNLSNASCRTFKGHGKGVYPLIFIPAEDFDLTDGATINPGDTIISGSADMTARSWSFDTGSCLKVQDGIRVARFTKIPTFS
jgi:WD40 repeat protein